MFQKGLVTLTEVRQSQEWPAREDETAQFQSIAKVQDRRYSARDLLGSFPDRYLDELRGQPVALRRAAGGLWDQLSTLLRLAEVGGSRPIVCSGMGGSYAVCHAPVTEMAGRGIQVAMVDAAELVDFRRPMLLPETMLVAVSQSGESAEVVRLVETLRSQPRRPTVVSVTNGLGNPVAEAADLALDTRAGDEFGPSTLTFGTALVVLSALALILSGEAAESAAEKTQLAADQAAAAAENLLSMQPQLTGELRSWLADHAVLALLGRGSARAATEMGALLLKEAARFPAESLETAQFRHGPLELAGPLAAVAIVASEPATSDRDLRLAHELNEDGTAVLVISPDGAGPKSAMKLAVGQLERTLSPAVTVIPFQFLAGAVAGERGYEPCELERASKVTADE
jgi:glucosamine--fructose-6-phosphate aminotransferase (isomerizing)